jgi:hypothetical protein
LRLKCTLFFQRAVWLGSDKKITFDLYTLTLINAMTMIKKLFWVFILQFIVLFSFAQENTGQPHSLTFRVNAGTTFTFVPGFSNSILVAPEGMIVPGYIFPNNAMSISTVRATSTARSLLGWHAEAEVHYRLPHNFSLSVGVGLKKMRFDYTSKFTFNQTRVDMNDINRQFGETNLLYLSVTPFNISKELGNRFIIQAGPVLNWLLDHKAYNTVAIYNTPEAQANGRPSTVYFDTMGNMRKMIWGLNLGASYKIIGPLYIKASAQFYGKSIYESKSYFSLDVPKVKPVSVQGGVVFAF